MINSGLSWPSRKSMQRAAQVGKFIFFSKSAAKKRHRGNWGNWGILLLFRERPRRVRVRVDRFLVEHRHVNHFFTTRLLANRFVYGTLKFGWCAFVLWHCLKLGALVTHPRVWPMAPHTVRSLANERRLATSACAPTIMPPGKLDGTDREHDEFTTDVYKICIWSRINLWSGIFVA